MKQISPSLSRGSILLLALVVSSVIMTVTVGFFNYYASAVRAERFALASAQARSLSEAGIDKAVYEFNQNPGYSGENNTVLGNGTFSVSVASIDSNTKRVTVTSFVPNSARPTATKVVQATVSINSSVASFHYGVQVGDGGVTMNNGSKIIGNIYSNGNITGSGTVTGSAIAASTIALTADQINDSPTPPTYNIVFGNANATQDFAQSFKVSTTSVINKAAVYVKRTSTTPSNITLRVMTDSGGNPGSTITSATLSASLVTTSYGWVEVAFPSGEGLIEGVTYWLVLDTSTGSATKNYTIGGNTAYTLGQGKIGQNGSSWGNTSPSGLDGYFKIYVGGSNSVIDDVTVGENGVGNAWAHTVTDSTIAGTLYCQSGTGNNKTCNTSQPDPSPQSFPISQANMDSWKDAAAAGGTINGNYTLDDENVSLGPTKIVGDLTIKNGSTLTLTGTLWVTGNILLSNNVLIELSPSYGNASGIIIADGWIDLSNNSTFKGSGQPNSYVFVATTNDCPRTSCPGHALDVGNNTTGVIFFAPYGTLHLKNNSGAQEATAYEIRLDNNVTITYNSGLANVNFSSGPGGSWAVVPGTYAITR